MPYRIFAPLLAYAALVLPAAAAPIVQIAGKSYAKEEIRAIMVSEKFDLPSQAIEKLRKEEVLRAWALKNGVTEEKAAGEFYRKSFGREMPMDRAGAQAPDLPLIRNQAGARLHILDAWLAEASQEVPLRYLDFAGYWDLMQQSNAYRIRKEHGHAPEVSEMEYTVAELSIPGNQPIAMEGGSVFLDGSEFNAYLAGNYPEILASLRRKQTLGEARSRLARQIVREKAILGSLAPGEMVWKELEIDRQVEAFVKKNMLRGELSLVGKEFESPSRYMESIQRDYHKRNVLLLKSLRESLQQGFRKKTGIVSVDLHAAKVMLEKKRTQIAEKLPDDELFDWMKAEKFPGNRQEALFVLSHRKMEELGSKALETRGIVFRAMPAD